MLKHINLDDDDELRNLASMGDPRVTSEQNPGGNRAIAYTKMEMAEDGNVYLMRWTNPAILYAVSAGGAVVRRFAVNPGNPSYRPVTIWKGGISLRMKRVPRENRLTANWAPHLLRQLSQCPATWQDQQKERRFCCRIHASLHNKPGALYFSVCRGGKRIRNQDRPAAMKARLHRSSNRQQ
jgi:hypothetical protein